jgi:hypothetical protein
MPCPTIDFDGQPAGHEGDVDPVLGPGHCHQVVDHPAVDPRTSEQPVQDPFCI